MLISRRMRSLAARTKRRDDPMIAQSSGECVIRHLQFPRVDAQARQRSSRPQASQATLERLLRAQRFDRHVNAARQPQDLMNYIVLANVQRDIGAIRRAISSRFASASTPMTSNAPMSLAPAVAHKPDRALGKDDDAVADLHAAGFRPGKSGRCDIRQEDHLLVA